VCGELDGLWAVRAELERGDGDAVCAWVSVGFEDPAPVDDARVPLTLFGVYVYSPEWPDGCCDRASLGVGWRTGEKKKSSVMNKKRESKEDFVCWAAGAARRTRRILQSRRILVHELQVVWCYYTDIRKEGRKE
jgi:hypothetical protein